MGGYLHGHYSWWRGGYTQRMKQELIHDLSMGSRYFDDAQNGVTAIRNKQVTMQYMLQR